MKLKCLVLGHEYDSCHHCIRCGNDSCALHDWEPWTYVRTDSCNQERKCKVCDRVESRSDFHERITIEGESYSEMWTCERCHQSSPTEKAKEDAESAGWSYP